MSEPPCVNGCIHRFDLVWIKNRSLRGKSKFSTAAGAFLIEDMWYVPHFDLGSVFLDCGLKKVAYTRCGTFHIFINRVGTAISEMDMWYVPHLNSCTIFVGMSSEMYKHSRNSCGRQTGYISYLTEGLWLCTVQSFNHFVRKSADLAKLKCFRHF